MVLSMSPILRTLLGACSVLWFSCGEAAANSSTSLPTNHPIVIRIDTSKPVLKVFVDGRLSVTYPVALGKVKTETPIGTWHVVDKQKHWGAGFGSRWLGLDVPWGAYGIHGTNRPFSIGTYASNGCIRMLNSDVEQLYELVPIGTPVVVEGDPIKSLRTLKNGNIGADVQWVQQRLHKAGYFRGPCNGKFGQDTQFALVFYQLSRRIPMDGVVDEDDYDKLKLV